VPETNWSSTQIVRLRQSLKYNRTTSEDTIATTPIVLLWHLESLGKRESRFLVFCSSLLLLSSNYLCFPSLSRLESLLVSLALLLTLEARMRVDCIVPNFRNLSQLPPFTLNNVRPSFEADRTLYWWAWGERTGLGEKEPSQRVRRKITPELRWVQLSLSFC